MGLHARLDAEGDSSNYLEENLRDDWCRPPTLIPRARVRSWARFPVELAVQQDPLQICELKFFDRPPGLTTLSIAIDPSTPSHPKVTDFRFGQSYWNAKAEVTD